MLLVLLCSHRCLMLATVSGQGVLPSITLKGEQKKKNSSHGVTRTYVKIAKCTVLRSVNNNEEAGASLCTERQITIATGASSAPDNGCFRCWLSVLGSSCACGTTSLIILGAVASCHSRHTLTPCFLLLSILLMTVHNAYKYAP